ncbi:winged helix DNA-binding domain-containing protein [Pseudonocardia yuanmonensis]|uniref:Winged helix DNA-binding domain-containing protein n=1 Tax=Pseudonocardia yuanmonensis TaxID=1095914 RepID=A0ABP8XCA4_9PSEU
MSVRRLDRRTLNRATLHRQWLAVRRDAPVAAALTHLVGLQAQEPHEPYTGLWSRLAGFAPAELVTQLEERRAVRALMMRRTLHLLTAADCAGMRPLFQTMLVQKVRGTLGRRLVGVDLDELAAAGRPLFHEGPRTPVDVARELAGRWPGAPVRDLGDALSTVVPLVQVPPRGLWGRTGPGATTTLEAWLGAASAPELDVAEVVRRYLRAYGPAARADVRVWSGLTGLPAVVERLRPELVTYRDERGRELLDLAGEEMPDPDLPVPPRFLPAFDNAVLGYDDRSRIIDDEHRLLSVAGARYVLIDGRVAATWTSSAGDGEVTVAVAPLRPFSRAERDEVAAEGERLAAFLGDGTPGRVSFS